MADFNSLTPVEQARIMDVITKQFSNGTRINQNRAREALTSNPQYARAMMGRAGIGPADQNSAEDANASAIQMAITNSLRDGKDTPAPDNAKAAPQAASGRSKGAKSMKPMQRAKNSSEGGREANYAAEEVAHEARRGKGFSKIANGDSTSAGQGESTDMTGPALVGGGAAGMYALYRMMKGKQPMQMPAEADQPAIESPAKRLALPAPDNIEDAEYTTMREVTGPDPRAPQITEQKRLPAPPAAVDPPMVDGGAYEPSPQDLEVMQSILQRGPQGMTSKIDSPPWTTDIGASSVNPKAPNMRETISKGLRKQLYGVGRF